MQADVRSEVGVDEVSLSSQLSAGVTSTPVSLLSADGVHLHLDHLTPAKPAGAAILITPAMGAPARAYGKLSEGLATMGHTIGILDFRGGGRSGARPSRAENFGVRKFLDQDLCAAVNWMRGEYPDRKLILLGHSFGGQLNSAFAGKNAGSVDALINLCAVWIHFRALGGFDRQLKAFLFYVLMRALAETLGYSPGDRLGWGARFARQHIRDWSNWGLAGRYAYRGGDARALLGRVTQPTLSISFTDDKTLGPEPACDRFCEAMASAPITRWKLAPEDIAKSSVGHFGMLKGVDVFCSKLDQWVREHVLTDAHVPDRSIQHDQGA